MQSVLSRVILGGCTPSDLRWGCRRCGGKLKGEEEVLQEAVLQKEVLQDENEKTSSK